MNTSIGFVSEQVRDEQRGRVRVAHPHSPILHLVSPCCGVSACVCNRAAQWQDVQTIKQPGRQTYNAAIYHAAQLPEPLNSACV